jgi:N-acyl-D-aspartate/D-glutamate deacylase
VGADADIVIFDPETVAARASYANPFLPPAGLRFVLVGGQVAAQDGELMIVKGNGAKLLSQSAID